MMTATDGSQRQALLGLVLPDLDAYRRLLHLIREDPAVDEVELSVGAPLFKGSPAIKAALEAGNGGLKAKIDTYFEHGLSDETARVEFARKYSASYLSRHPRSERQDVFAASSEVFVFAFDLRQPLQLPYPQEAYDAIAGGPHSPESLARLQSGIGLPKPSLKVFLRLFLDFAPNPRRHGEPLVRDAIAGLGLKTPFVIEVDVSGDIAGWAGFVLYRVAQQVGGTAVWLKA